MYSSCNLLSVPALWSCTSVPRRDPSSISSSRSVTSQLSWKSRFREMTWGNIKQGFDAYVIGKEDAPGIVVLQECLYQGKLRLDVAEAQHLMDGLDWQGWRVTGYCMGGALAIASSVLVPGVDAVVSFYGLPSPELADPLHSKAPAQAHFGELDNFVGFSNVKVWSGDSCDTCTLLHKLHFSSKGCVLGSNHLPHGGRGALPSEGSNPSDLLFLAAGCFYY
ncbi:unnamed protein product [Fraxinus pennsylvanica]|uniref:Dienelactone hydrolase domain-containing protein n=1 Tax=Fraxinus pennsylvanica TaxID=56036 RepID=A0AAD2A2K2_9LAMI|nr:unnamed protein product [Fraxinus pennsylvanica]